MQVDEVENPVEYQAVTHLKSSEKEECSTWNTPALIAQQQKCLLSWFSGEIGDASVLGRIIS